MLQNNNEIETPPGVSLVDYNDYGAIRGNILKRVRKSMRKAFPISYGGVRMEIDDIGYDDEEPISLLEQKDALLKDKYLTKKLRGNVRIVDEATNTTLDEKKLSLMRVPWLTNRGSFIHGGNEYTTITQSRLIPGVYTRRQANGHLETQFNVKPGTGVGFRVGFEPDTAQYRVKVSQANLHMYSLLHDLGVGDEELIKKWGPEIFKANQAKYDSRVLGKAYERLVPKRFRKVEVSNEEKAAQVKEAFNKASISSYVANRNLPSMMGEKFASAERAKWAGREAMLKLAAEMAERMPFEPDFTPDQLKSELAFSEKSAGYDVENLTGEDSDDNADVWHAKDKKFYTVKVPLIHKRVEGREASEMPISSVWGGSETSPGFSEDRVTNADTSYPIVLDGYTEGDGFEGGLVDGRHRKIKLQRQGEKNIKAIKLSDEDIDSIVAESRSSKTSSVDSLLQAKDHSDKKQYGAKNRIMALMMYKTPDEFLVDSDDGKFLGITHAPTGFRMHLPKNIVPAVVRSNTMDSKAASIYEEFAPDFGNFD